MLSTPHELLPAFCQTAYEIVSLRLTCRSLHAAVDLRTFEKVDKYLWRSRFYEFGFTVRAGVTTLIADEAILATPNRAKYFWSLDRTITPMNYTMGLEFVGERENLYKVVSRSNGGCVHFNTYKKLFVKHVDEPRDSLVLFMRPIAFPGAQNCNTVRGPWVVISQFTRCRIPCVIMRQM